jgi:hypothetical protein
MIDVIGTKDCTAILSKTRTWSKFRRCNVTTTCSCFTVPGAKAQDLQILA